VRIALFITCLTEQFYPRVGIATVKVLEYLGHEVTFPAAQTCCGQPMFNNGFHDEARNLAVRMIEVFADAPWVVTPSASCAAMVREHMPQLFAEHTPARARSEELAHRTLEFVEFLTRFHSDAFARLSLPAPAAATFHRSCHLRSLGMSDEALSLTRGITNLNVTPLPQADQCCGFGGTFATAYPEISGVMVREKAQAIRATNVDVVLCNEAGCAMNIEGACRRAGIHARFTSTAELLAEALGLMDRVEEFP